MKGRFPENGWTSRFCGRNLKFVKLQGLKKYISMIVIVILSLTSCSIHHGWKSTSEIVATKKDSAGVIVEQIERETHLIRKFYWFSPEGMTDDWVPDRPSFYLKNTNGKRTPLNFLAKEVTPYFFPLVEDRWIAIYEVKSSAYSDLFDRYGDLDVTVFDERGINHTSTVMGCYYLATSMNKILTPNWRPLRENMKDYDFNHKIDFEANNIIFRTYKGDFIFKISDGTLKPSPSDKKTD